MKIYATYGLVGAALAALQQLALFFAGLHGERIHLLQDLKVTIPLGLVGFAVSIAVLVLGIRAWREAAPGKAMSYGRGLGGGVLIGLFQGLGTMVFTIVYGLVINPGFKEAMVGSQIAKMQASGAPAQAVEMAEKMMNIMMSPVVQGLMAIPGTVIFALVISLIAAAVLKRADTAAQGVPVVPPAL